MTMRSKHYQSKDWTIGGALKKGFSLQDASIVYPHINYGVYDEWGCWAGRTKWYDIDSKIVKKLENGEL